MSWVCPECGSKNENELIKCHCGYTQDEIINNEANITSVQKIKKRDLLLKIFSLSFIPIIALTAHYAEFLVGIVFVFFFIALSILSINHMNTICPSCGKKFFGPMSFLNFYSSLECDYCKFSIRSKNKKYNQFERNFKIVLLLVVIAFFTLLPILFLTGAFIN